MLGGGDLGADLRITIGIVVAAERERAIAIDPHRNGGGCWEQDARRVGWLVPPAKLECRSSSTSSPRRPVRVPAYPKFIVQPVT